MAVRRDSLARKKIGWALRIQHEIGLRKGEWEQVGFIEPSRSLLLEYKQRNHPTVKNFTIMGVRVDSRPVTVETKPIDRSRRPL